MHSINFCVIFNFCVKQLTIFERTVVAASDLKNCTMSTVAHCISISGEMIGNFESCIGR